MKKRFRNILERSGKRSGLNLLVCTLGLVIGLGFLVGCSVSESDRLGNTSGQEGALEGTAADSVDVPDIVPDQSKEPFSENIDTTTLTYTMEGKPVEQTAALFTGSGYSIYIPDNDWALCGPDLWHSVHDDKIQFWITYFADQDMSQVKRELFFSQEMRPDEEGVRENELTGQKEDIITRVRLIEQPETSCVGAVFYSYPEEANRRRWSKTTDDC